MSERHKPVSCLEHLPNELLLMILAYLPPSDRLRTFTNLNSRLNAVLREAGAGVDDNLVMDACLLSDLSSCITVVNLQRRCEIIDLYNLENIRSLKILHTMRYQIVAIDPMYMPKLTTLYLTSPTNTLDACYGRLLELILNQNFESLVSVYLPQAHFFGVYNCAGHSGLLYLTIGACHSSRFASLIGLMPNVRHLEVQHLISWPIRQTVIHSQIRYLKFRVNCQTIETKDIHALNIAMPSLKHVRVIELKTRPDKCLPLSSFDTTLNDDDAYDHDN